MDADALIESTAAAVAEGYRALDLADCAGLLLSTYYDGAPEQLAPLALELRAGEVTPDVDRDGEQRELGMPEVDRDPPVFELCETLNEHIMRDDDGHVLIEAYWLALANRLHALLGMPVLACEIEMPIAEQLRRQLATPMSADPLTGLDVAVSLPIDEQRIAAVWREELSLWGAARVPGEPWPVGWNTQLGSDPEVRAGWLPPGAVAASVCDRAGAWHEARTGGGVWLCALPQRSGQNDPPVAYRDVEGTEFRLEVEVDGLPGLWPVQAGVAPRLSQRSSDVLGYHGGGWWVFIEGHGGHEQDTDFRPLPGTVLGRPHGFGLELRHGRWRAVAVCGAFTVDIQGDGEPPARLDLEAVPRD
jgi:hypothetical protein